MAPNTQTGTYTPTSHSLPGRMIAFFRANPDEELTLEDITEKFDCVTASIHTLLGTARSADMLARDKNKEGDWIYKRGPSLAAEPAAEAPPLTRAFREVAAQMRAPAAAPAVEVDPLTVPLETGVPLAGPVRGRVKQDWSQLLTRMEPGHSCVLPKIKRGLVTKAVKEHQAAHPARYAIRMQADKATIRVWRTE